LFQNPAFYEIFIQTDKEDSYMIFNMQGEKMKKGGITEKIQKIEIKDLVPGIYFTILNSVQTDYVRTSKLIIRWAIPVRKTIAELTQAFVIFTI
jgi:hypothetical protein